MFSILLLILCEILLTGMLDCLCVGSSPAHSHIQGSSIQERMSLSRRQEGSKSIKLWRHPEICLLEVAVPR